MELVREQEQYKVLVVVGLRGQMMDWKCVRIVRRIHYAVDIINVRNVVTIGTRRTTARAVDKADLDRVSHVVDR